MYTEALRVSKGLKIVKNMYNCTCMLKPKIPRLLFKK